MLRKKAPEIILNVHLEGLLCKISFPVAIIIVQSTRLFVTGHFFSESHFFHTLWVGNFSYIQDMPSFSFLEV